MLFTFDVIYVEMSFKIAKSIVYGTKIILQVSPINTYGWSCNANVGSNVIHTQNGKVNFWTPCMLNFETLSLGKGIPPRDHLLILFFSKFLCVGLRHSSHLFFNRIVSLWNQLQPHTRSSVSFSIFKTDAVLCLNQNLILILKPIVLAHGFLHVAALCVGVLRGEGEGGCFLGLGGMVLEVICTCSSHALHWYQFVF